MIAPCFIDSQLIASGAAMDLVGKVHFQSQANVVCRGHSQWVWSIACSKSGMLCSGSQDKHVILWNNVCL